MFNQSTPVLGDREAEERTPLLGDREAGERTPLLGNHNQEAEDHHRLYHEPHPVHDQHEPEHDRGNHLHYTHGHIQHNLQSGEGGELGSAERGHLDSDTHVHHIAKPKSYVYLGYSFAVMAGICFTSSNVMVKFVPDIDSWQLLFVRCMLQTFTMGPIMICTGSNPFGPPDFATRIRIMAQGVLGGGLLLAIFQAVSALPLGDATAIFFSSPAFTMLLSTCLLREHCGLFRTFIAIILLGGVVILSRPPAIFPVPEYINVTVTNTSDVFINNAAKAYKGKYEFLGLMSAFLVPVLSAWIVIITRQTKHVHYSVLVFWFGIGGQVVSVIGIFCFSKDSASLFQGWDVREWVLSFLVSLVGILGSILMTKSLKWVAPSKVMVVRSFEVVGAYILQVTVFHTPTYLSDVGGTLLILLAVLGMGLEDRAVKRFKWRFL